MKTKGKNIIIGVAYGYDFEKIKPFIASLEKINFKGKILLIANDNLLIPDRYRKLLDISLINEKGLRRSIALRAINKGLSLPYVRSMVKRTLNGVNQLSESIFLNAFIKVYHVVNARLAFYLKFLRKNEFDNVFLTDVRDVVFQADPFENFAGGCNVFNENEYLSIAGCKWNSSWIREGYGEAELLKIGEKEIYCAGTILSDYGSMLLLLAKMLQACLDWKGRMNIYGPDMGSFNYLIHNDLIDNMVKRKNGDIVLTISPETYDQIKSTSRGVEYNGFFPAVVHQYDRLPALVDFYR